MVSHIEPKKNNIHVVKALEKNAAFFDILIPGYKNQTCKYYMCEENPIIINKSKNLIKNNLTKKCDENEEENNEESNQTIYFLYEKNELGNIRMRSHLY